MAPFHPSPSRAGTLPFSLIVGGFTWLRVPRYVPKAGPAVEACAPDGSSFLSLEIVDRLRIEEHLEVAASTPAPGMIEIGVAGGHRLRIVGTYDPAALARLIRRLSA